jgi:hypothetical protein
MICLRCQSKKALLTEASKGCKGGYGVRTHASGNSSPTRASSFAQAIRDVSWWHDFPSTVPAEPQQPLPAASETPSCSPFFASRCLPIFPTAAAVTAGRRGWFGLSKQRLDHKRILTSADHAG